MSRKTVAVLAAVLASLFCCKAQVAFAQEGDSAKAATQESIQPIAAYRLDFSVNEMEDGKKINTRQYSMNLNAGDSNSIKIGARVPVEPKNGEFQYLDIGTNIWSRLKERGSTIALEVKADVSNIAAPDQQSQRPIVRQVQISASTVAVPGKPMVVGIVDDPSSKRQFQLEVTVTKLR